MVLLSVALSGIVEKFSTCSNFSVENHFIYSRSNSENGAFKKILLKMWIKYWKTQPVS